MPVARCQFYSQKSQSLHDISNFTPASFLPKSREICSQNVFQDYIRHLDL